MSIHAGLNPTAALQAGGEYEVLETTRTFADTFSTGARYVYVHSVHNFRDGILGYVFYNPSNGAYSSYDVDDENRYNIDEYNDSYDESLAEGRVIPAPERVMRLCGGWIRPATMPHDAPDLTAPALGIESPQMRVFLPYLQDLLEGKEGIDNWFDWWEKNGTVLTTILKRAEFLRLKHTPLREIERIFTVLDIPTRRNPRYGWLG